MRKVEGSSMSEPENRKFQITEYMTQTNQMNERHTFTLCYCFLYHSLMSHNWLGTAKLQKKLSMRVYSSMEDHHDSLQKMLQAQSKVQRINEARKEEEVPEDENEAVEEEGVKLAGEAEAAMNDVHDMDYDTIGLLE